MAYIDQTRFINYLKMDTMDDVDNMTKNIVREIIRECKSKDLQIEEDFCIYFVSILYLCSYYNYTLKIIFITY